MKEHLLYRKWIHDGNCMPQIAACLIKGKDPDVCIAQEENESEYDEDTKRYISYIKMDDPEMQDLVELLCDGGYKWWAHTNKTIFCHVNKALKNSVEIEDIFLNEIHKHFLNYTEIDKNSFIETHPYITHALNLKRSMPAINKGKQSNEDSEREILLKIIFGMAIDAYGYSPDRSRNEATGSKKGSISYNLTLLGLDISDDTIRKYLTEASNYFSASKPHKY